MNVYRSRNKKESIVHSVLDQFNFHTTIIGDPMGDEYSTLLSGVKILYMRRWDNLRGALEEGPSQVEYGVRQGVIEEVRKLVNRKDKS